MCRRAFHLACSMPLVRQHSPTQHDTTALHVDISSDHVTLQMFMAPYTSLKTHTDLSFQHATGPDPCTT